jgi:hypothetical protein
MTKPAQEFEAEVKKAASMILAASYKASLAMLDEVFSQRGEYQLIASRPEQRSSSAPKHSNVRRSPEDIDAITGKLMQELWSTPGQTITAIASRLGLSPGELRVPVRRLKNDGQVKTAGVGQLTKYFPLSAPAGNQKQSQ